jgi:hypothetical protein
MPGNLTSGGCLASVRCVPTTDIGRLSPGGFPSPLRSVDLQAIWPHHPSPNGEIWWIADIREVAAILTNGRVWAVIAAAAKVPGLHGR